MDEDFLHAVSPCPSSLGLHELCTRYIYICLIAQTKRMLGSIIILHPL